MEHSKFGMMSLDDLRLFVALGEAKSFALAARRTRTPASTLSRRIAALEEALAMRLVHRTPRRVALTADGERLLSRASGHVAALEAVGERDDAPSGRLRVTAPLASGADVVAPALMRFAQRYPNVEVELNLTNAVLPVIEEGIDLAFRAAMPSDGDLVARRVASWPFAFAAAPGVCPSRISLERLREVPGVLTRGNMSWRLVREDASGVDDVRPERRFVVNDPRVALEAAVAGLGVVASPRERIAAYGKKLVTVHVRGRSLAPRELFAVYPSRTLVPARVRLALEEVHSVLAERQRARAM